MNKDKEVINKIEELKCKNDLCQQYNLNSLHNCNSRDVVKGKEVCFDKLKKIPRLPDCKTVRCDNYNDVEKYSCKFKRPEIVKCENRTIDLPWTNIGELMKDYPDLHFVYNNKWMYWIKKRNAFETGKAVKYGKNLCLCSTDSFYEALECLFKGVS